MSNIDLYRFKAPDVLEIAQDAHDEFVRIRTHPADLMFRDEKGAYWTVEVESNVWYRHSQGGWHRSDPPNGILEGPFSLMTKPIPELPQHGNLEPVNSQVELVETIVGRVRKGYEEGFFASLAAEVCVKGAVAIDSERNVCMVGVSSGDWYSFKRKTWKRIPRLDSAALLEDDESISSVLKEFLSKDAGLPEQVTDPWNPPSGIPKTIICTQCNANVQSDSLFCIECGASTKLPATKAVEPALTTGEWSRFARIKQLPAARTLLGVLVIVGISAVIPYMCYAALSIALDRTTSAVAIFACSLLMSFGFFAYSLKTRRTPSALTEGAIVGADQVAAPMVQSATPPGALTCERCGASVKSGTRFCVKCGTRLETVQLGDIYEVQSVETPTIRTEPTPSLDKKPKRRRARASQAAPASEFRFCAKCGTRIMPDDSFCEKCGAPKQ